MSRGREALEAALLDAARRIMVAHARGNTMAADELGPATAATCRALRSCVAPRLAMALAATLAATAWGERTHAAETPHAGPRRVVLTLSGVGWFEWQPPGKGPWTVASRPDDIDDMLKSLTGVHGTRIGSVTMASPPGEADASGIVPAEGARSAATLLAGMVGRTVTLAGPGDATATGILVAVEPTQQVPAGGRAAVGRTRLTVDTGGTLVQRVLEDLSSTTLADQGLADRVGKAFEAIGARSAEQPVPVVITARPGPDGAAFAATLPVPLWKATYRLRAGDAGSNQGTLEGWAVVQNAGAEDWEDVSLALRSGNPASFTEALYARTDVVRPSAAVDQQAHALPGLDERGIAVRQRGATEQGAAGEGGPGGARMEAMTAMPAAGPLAAMRTMQATEAMAPSPPANGPAASDQPPPTPAAAVGETYEIAGPVSLAAGRTASLAFLRATPPVERVDVIRPGEAHPTSALRVANDGTAAWPPGPVSIADAGGFAGDARMPAMPPGESRMLAYAQDLRITARWDRTPSRILASYVAADGIARLGVIQRDTTSVDIAGAAAATDGTGATDVVIELPRAEGTTATGHGVTARDATASSWRFTITIAPGHDGHAGIDIDRTLHERISIADAPEALAELAAAPGGLPAEAANALAPILRLRAAATRSDVEAGELERTRSGASGNEQRIRENMRMFTAGDPQRSRYAIELARLDDTITVLDARIETARDAGDEARRRMAAMLSGLRLGTP